MRNEEDTIFYNAGRLVAVATYAAPTIRMLNDSSPSYTFRILEDGFGGYAAGTTMDTYCMEYHEQFRPGNAYYAVLNTSAMNGGMDWAGGVYGQGPLVPANGDLLDERTAFLYTRFMEGDSRLTDEVKLQRAVHYIEAEFKDADVIGSKNEYVILAEEAVDTGGEWDGMGIGNVRVMNLWKDFDGETYSGFVQDQLILMNPVPAPGAILLGSTGIMLVGWMRRRQNR